MREFLENVEKGAEDESIYNPIKAAQVAMRPQLPKRFYKNAAVAETDGGFTVELDGRTLKTPAKQTTLVPTDACAQLLADEWQAQEKEIDPGKMPFTRIINTALDAVADQQPEVLADIVSFAGNDLICYRADNPKGLEESQNTQWNPLVEWLRERFDIRLVLAEGIIHQPQTDDAMQKFAEALQPHGEPIQLSCLHTFTTLSGSAVIALAIAERHLDLNKAWDCAHVDEDWNISNWGEDHDAVVRREKRLQEFTAAFELFQSVCKE